MKNLTPNEMRVRLREAAHGRPVDPEVKDFGFPPCSPMIRACRDVAASQGWSGEDAMTLLAFEALKMLEQLLAAELQHRMLEPAPRWTEIKA